MLARCGDRRGFLMNVGLGALGIVGLPQAASAAEWTAIEKANVQVVNDFCAAWSTGDVAKIVSYMSNDVVFKNGGTPPMVGRDASAERIKGVFARYKSIVFEVVETFARGPIVMNERIDYLTQPDGTRRDIRLVGVFALNDGKITEWSDYGIRSAGTLRAAFQKRLSGLIRCMSRVRERGPFA